MTISSFHTGPVTLQRCVVFLRPRITIISRSYVSLLYIVNGRRVCSPQTPTPSVPKLRTSSVPLPHTDIEAKRLPQEALSRQHVVLVKLELITTENSGDDKRELHLRHIPSNTRSWSVREWDEGLLLSDRVRLACATIGDIIILTFRLLYPNAPV